MSFDLPFGDHPFGTYRVTMLEPGKLPAHTYGPGFLLLDPVAGDALEGKEHGRAGLGIHGGAPLPDGTLRATDGCLRVRNDTAEALLAHVTVGTEYVCEEFTPNTGP